MLGPLRRKQQATSMDVIRLAMERLPVPVRTLPYWLMWASARFDQTTRLALSYYGVPVLVSADKARQEAGRLLS